MMIDATLRVSVAQAFTGVAVSTNSIDCGVPPRPLGTGEPMGFGLQVTAGLAGTSLLVELISATDDALTAGIVVHASRSFLAADVATGALLFIGLPIGQPTQRYIGLRITPSGGAATVTLTAWLSPRDAFSIAARAWPKSSTV